MIVTVLRYVWAAPASAVGLLIAAIACAGGARARVAGGLLEVAGGRWGRAVGRLREPWAFDAITFGHVVLAVDARCLDRCRAHERVHVRQYERWGALFFPLYLGSSLLQWALGRHPYWDNHFEREAHAVAPSEPVPARLR